MRYSRLWFVPVASLLALTALGTGAAWAQKGAPPAVVATGPTLSLAERREVFNTIWTKINDSYYDPKFGGLDWKAVKVKYAPKIDKAPNDAAFYAALQQMVGELKQSHFAVIPPDSFRTEEEIKEAAGSTPSATNGQPPAPGRMLPGTVGMVVQLVEKRPTITRVIEGSGALAAGLKPGFVLTEISGQPIDKYLAALKKRARTDREYATLVRLSMEGVLSGPSGSMVAIGYLDGDDKPQMATVTRGRLAGIPATLGYLPIIFVNVEQKRVDSNIGYVGFNIFLMPIRQPVLDAVAGFADAPGIIIDVRGNPGGIGQLATTVAQSFYDKEVNLGVMHQRKDVAKFPVFPVDKPFLGPVAILTDEGSASTSEILAAGMQETGRAVTVGTTTAGEALPSQIELLPGGVRLQYAIADLKTPKGKMIEGAGVTPNIAVPLTRSALLTGRDPVLDAAVAYIKGEVAKRAVPPPATR